MFAVSGVSSTFLCLTNLLNNVDFGGKAWIGKCRGA